MPPDAEAFLEALAQRHPHQPAFHQAVHEFVHSVWEVADAPRYRDAAVLERMVEPERAVLFRVLWEGDDGALHVQRGYRVQFNGAIGPYKGGLRFHPTVDLDVLKFLGFEQTFKNALTGLQMGGGKGGSDFDPKGRSDAEVRRFCQAFMTELHRHIGPDTDVPAGDIGVGAREIGWLFGQYRRLANAFHGTLTGKGLAFGGSPLRTEATGYGLVYLTAHALGRRGRALEGLSAVVSGSGNVALHAAEKLLREGATVLTLSDSGGFVHDPDGIDEGKLAWVKELKLERRGRLAEYPEAFPSATFTEGAAPWSVPCDWAFPCATQNELDAKGAKALVKHGCLGVSEGANMPSTAEAVEVFREAGLVFLPGKAANAGGVATSGLEMAQNHQFERWSRATVDERLRGIMADIHDRCVQHGVRDDATVDYVRGANIAGFLRVADAMLAQGV